MHLQFDIVWDDAKAQSNLLKHGVSFAQAATVMLDPLALTVFDAERSEAEERWFTLGPNQRWAFVGRSPYVSDAGNQYRESPPDFGP